LRLQKITLEEMDQVNKFEADGYGSFSGTIE
jgi:hypothetical protein